MIGRGPSLRDYTTVYNPFNTLLRSEPGLGPGIGVSGTFSDIACRSRKLPGVGEILRS